MKRRLQEHRRHVVLLISTRRSYGREILDGIRAFSGTLGRDRWEFSSVYLEGESILRRIARRECDGVIGILSERKTARAVCRSGLPFVNLDGSMPWAPEPRVLVDNQCAGRMAAEYYLQRGYTRLAYVGVAARVSSTQRQEGMASFVRKHPQELDFLALDIPQGSSMLTGRALAQWTQKNPAPVGILAFNEAIAHATIRYLQGRVIPVPEKAAVLGIDNDRHFCELNAPTISSIATGCQRIGHRAAAILKDLMDGDARPTGTTWIKPLGIITRQSTEALAVADDLVAAAIAFIREHACDPIQVPDVARHVGICRRSLERRFFSCLGRHPHDEIRRVQLERAKRLLAETKIPLSQIADAVGFRDSRWLSRVFRAEEGTTVTNYRRMFLATP